MEKDTYTASCIFCNESQEFFICETCQGVTRNKLEGFQIAAILPKRTNFIQMPTKSDDELPTVTQYKSTEELLLAMKLYDSEEDNGTWIYALNLIVYITGKLLPNNILDIYEIIKSYCSVICLIEHESDIICLPNDMLCLVQEFSKRSIVEWFSQYEKISQEVLIIMCRHMST